MGFPGCQIYLLCVWNQRAMFLPSSLSDRSLSVNNCEGSEILPDLQANKLACHIFMDTGRRHKAPRSENMEKLLLTAIVVAKVPAFFALIP